MKLRLGMTPEKVQRLKDQTNLSNQGISKWIDALDGLLCSKSALEAFFRMRKEDFEKALVPTETPDGYIIQLDRLLYLMEAAYSMVLGDTLIKGINMDATVLANRSITSASVRLLNDSLEWNGIRVNSSANEYSFALFYGKDDKIYLAENVFRNGQPGYLPFSLAHIS